MAIRQEYEALVGKKVKEGMAIECRFNVTTLSGDIVSRATPPALSPPPRRILGA